MHYNFHSLQNESSNQRLDKMRAIIFILVAVSMLCQSKNIIIDFNGKQFKLTKEQALRSGLLSELVTDQDDDDCDEDMIIPVTIDKIANSQRDDVIDCLFKEADIGYDDDSVAFSTPEGKVSELKYLYAKGYNDVGLQDPHDCIPNSALWKIELTGDEYFRLKNMETGKYLSFEGGRAGDYVRCDGDGGRDSSKLQFFPFCGPGDEFLIESKVHRWHFLGYPSGRHIRSQHLGGCRFTVVKKKWRMEAKLAQKPMDLIVDVFVAAHYLSHNAAKSVAKEKVVTHLNEQRAGGKMLDTSGISHRILKDEIFPQVRNIFSKIDILNYLNEADELKKCLEDCDADSGRVDMSIQQMIDTNDMVRLVSVLKHLPHKVATMRRRFPQNEFLQRAVLQANVSSLVCQL